MSKTLSAISEDLETLRNRQAELESVKQELVDVKRQIKFLEGVKNSLDPSSPTSQAPTRDIVSSILQKVLDDEPMERPAIVDELEKQLAREGFSKQGLALRLKQCLKEHVEVDGGYIRAAAT